MRASHPVRNRPASNPESELRRRKPLSSTPCVLPGLAVRVVARKRGPSGDLTAKTRVRPVSTLMAGCAVASRKRDPAPRFTGPATVEAERLAWRRTERFSESW